MKSNPTGRNTGSATADLSGKSCNANTVHWLYDTWMLANGTGKAIVVGLIAALRRCPNITILTNATAVDLITFPHHSRDPLAAYRPISCHGAYVFDRDERTLRLARILWQPTRMAGIAQDPPIDIKRKVEQVRKKPRP